MPTREPLLTVQALRPLEGPSKETGCCRDRVTDRYTHKLGEDIDPVREQMECGLISFPFVLGLVGWGWH